MGRLLGATRPPQHSASALKGQVERGNPRAPTQAPFPSATGTKGAISMLQEFVQCSQNFHIPPNYPVLQWSFDSQMADSATLEFRAVVAFLLEGVPHHVAGTWQLKKKDAQRDAAERALGLFVGRWSVEVLREDSTNASQAASTDSDNAPGVLLEKCFASLQI